MTTQNLGLIGGLAPPATIHYYRELVRHSPGELLIVHADVNRVLQHVEHGENDALAAYFARLIERLAHGGATFAAISAVAPHACIRELQRISPLPLVSIIDEISAEIHRRGYRKVALFGTKFVVRSRLYGLLPDVEVLVPEQQVDAIHTAYMQIVRGDHPDQARAALVQIAQTLPVDAIVLAGTDLSTVFTPDTTEFPALDCAALHIRAILSKLR